MKKRQLTPAAQAAKMIKAHLRKNGINARVRSDNFSMGSSVDVTVADLLPAVLNAVKDYCSQYEYGYFDSSEDMYISSNHRDDIPQAKFVSVSCEYSDELAEEAYKWARAYYAGWEDLPRDYAAASNLYDENMRDWVSNVVVGILNGVRVTSFWTSRKPRQRVA